MLLTISTWIGATMTGATDLGFLLHKNPNRVHESELSFGMARVCYPEADDDRCTAALIVDIDPVSLIRGRRGRNGGHFSLSQYVNDRPYAASSFMSVALKTMFGTAMTGRCKDRPELAEQRIPLSVRVPVLPSRGGERVLRLLFEPLGYEVSATPIPLDDKFPDWDESRYLDVALEITAMLKDVLEQLFVLLPVLDDDKHYWVGDDEVEKLLRRGGEWLASHPEREMISRRYLRHDRRLTRDALSRLIEADDTVDDPDASVEKSDEREAALERPVRLNDLRMETGARAGPLQEIPMAVRGEASSTSLRRPHHPASVTRLVAWRRWRSRGAVYGWRREPR